MPGTTTYFELAWTVVCALTFCFSLVRFHSTMIDRAVALNRRARAIAGINVRQAGGRTYRQLVFTLIGIRAMTQPPATGQSWVGALLALAFVSLALADFVDAALVIREQHRLLDEEEARVRRERIPPSTLVALAENTQSNSVLTEATESLTEATENLTAAREGES